MHGFCPAPSSPPWAEEGVGTLDKESLLIEENLFTFLVSYSIVTKNTLNVRGLVGEGCP